MRDRLVPLTIWISLILSVAAVDAMMAPTPNHGAPPSIAVAFSR
ncbi:hypothetical protein [Plastoroseomonas hellenica]|nr:hypothetical protein [Plastoroseomonas hellenica]